MIPPQSSVYCSGVRLQEAPLVKAWLWLVRHLSSLPFFHRGILRDMGLCEYEIKGSNY